MAALEAKAEELLRQAGAQVLRLGVQAIQWFRHQAAAEEGRLLAPLLLRRGVT